MLRLLKLLPLFFLLGADWTENTNDEVSCTTMDASPGVCYFRPTTTEDTSILAVNQCENFDLIYNADTLTTDHDSTMIIYSCAIEVASIQTCEPINGMILDGDPDVGDFEILGAAAIWIYASATVSASDTPVLTINCHLR